MLVFWWQLVLGFLLREVLTRSFHHLSSCIPASGKAYREEDSLGLIASAPSPGPALIILGPTYCLGILFYMAPYPHFQDIIYWPPWLLLVYIKALFLNLLALVSVITQLVGKFYSAT